MSYNWHSDDFLVKCREQERRLDYLQDLHNGEEPECEPDPDDIDPDHPALERMRERMKR